MYKAFRFRLYPNGTQKEQLEKSFGCSRFVYNHYLNQTKQDGKKTAYENLGDYKNVLKNEYPFLQEVDSTLIRKTLFHLDDNLKRHKNNNFGFPKFKSKYDKNSYTTSAIYGSYKTNNYCNIELDLEKRQVKLPKLKWIKVRGYRRLEKINGRIVNATISREINGKYYISLLYSIPEIKLVVTPNSIVGIDIGIKKLLTLSDGTTYENNKYILKYEKRIKRFQKALARKVPKSNNYFKCKEKLRRLYSKLKNARKYYLHQITKEITDKYDIIVCETLKTKKLIMKKQISKSITDASFYEILRQLQYKSKFKNKYFYQVDTYYPSSQECSVCSSLDKKYKNLNERIYNCSICKNEIDRDLNASINIMFKGLKKYMKEVLSN